MSGTLCRNAATHVLAEPLSYLSATRLYGGVNGENGRGELSGGDSDVLSSVRGIAEIPQGLG